MELITMSEILTLIFSVFLTAVICYMVVAQYKNELRNENKNDEINDIIVVENVSIDKKDEEYEPPAYNEIVK